MATLENNSRVLEFYDKSKILITGGTGFMGKILIDKLLRVCSGVEQIYLVIRIKKGKDSSTRLKELFADPVFERLRKDCPDYASKVTCVPGDCGLLDLGINEDDLRFLSKEITHVFHVAATVRFDEKLKTAININIRGVQEMIKFCKTCDRLQSVVHVSTAYANCPQKKIEEKFYEPPISPDAAIDLTKVFSESKLDEITPDIIKPWPNTYSYTKAIAESVVKEQGKGLPIAVFRPSIVIGTNEEPVPGWIDNFYGPTGVVVAVAAGLMRVLPADGKSPADLIPVDLAINGLLSAAWDTARRFNNNTPEHQIISDGDTKLDAILASKTTPTVYNYVSSTENVLTWEEFLSYNFKYGRQMPTIKAIWYYTLTLTTVPWLYAMMTFLFHLLPAAIMDGCLKMAGKKPRIWAAYQKIHKFSQVISFFSTSTWAFSEDNTRNLWSSLSQRDKELFNFDMKSVHWETFFKNNIVGIRRYLFQDDPSTINAAKWKMFGFHIMHRIIQVCFILICYWFFSSTISLILNISAMIHRQAFIK